MHLLQPTFGDNSTIVLGGDVSLVSSREETGQLHPRGEKKRKITDEKHR